MGNPCTYLATVPSECRLPCGLGSASTIRYAAAGASHSHHHRILPSDAASGVFRDVLDLLHCARAGGCTVRREPTVGCSRRGAAANGYDTGFEASPVVKLQRLRAHVNGGCFRPVPAGSTTVTSRSSQSAPQLLPICGSDDGRLPRTTKRPTIPTPCTHRPPSRSRAWPVDAVLAGRALKEGAACVSSAMASSQNASAMDSPTRPMYTSLRQTLDIESTPCGHLCGRVVDRRSFRAAFVQIVGPACAIGRVEQAGLRCKRVDDALNCSPAAGSSFLGG